MQCSMSSEPTTESVQVKGEALEANGLFVEDDCVAGCSLLVEI